MLPRDVVHEGIIVGKHAESRIQQCCYGRRAGIVRRIRHKCNLLLFLHSRSSWWFRSRATRWTPATAPPSRLLWRIPTFGSAFHTRRPARFDIAFSESRHEFPPVHALK